MYKKLIHLPKTKGNNFNSMNIKIKWKDHNGFQLHEQGDVAYLTVPAFDREDWIQNAFSTRLGGISKG